MSRRETQSIDLSRIVHPNDAREIHQAGKSAKADDAKMRHAIYWLATHEDDPRGYVDVRCWYEQQVTHLAGKLALTNNPEDIAAIIERYQTIYESED